MINAETYNHDYEVARKFGYEQGKADGKAEMLEEIMNKAFCEWTNCEYCAMWGQYDEFGEEEVCILEQLKEQKNENNM